MSDHSTSPEAEAQLLSCVFIDPRLLPSAMQVVSVQHFAVQSHRHIWRAMVALQDEGADVDQLAVCDWLCGRPGDPKTNQTLLDVCGGSKAIARIVLDTPSSVVFESAIRIVAERRNRRMLRQSLGMATSALEEGRDSRDVLDGLNAQIQEMQSASSIAGDRDSWASTIAREVMRDLESGDELLARLKTGVGPLDSLLGGGVAIGMHSIIGALSGHGKTTIASAAIAGLLNHNPNLHVDWYGCEVPRKWQFCRIASSWADMPEDYWRDAARSKDAYRMAVDALGWGSELQDRLRIEHWSRIRMEDVALRTAIRRRAIGDAPLVVVVDYLQRATAGTSQKNNERIAEASALLAGLADDYTATIAMSQFTTEASGEPIPIPKPGHARWAKDIENDACDFVIYHRPMHESQPSLALIQLAKSRYGRLAHAWAVGSDTNRFGWARQFQERFDTSYRIPETVRGLATTEIRP